MTPTSTRTASAATSASTSTTSSKPSSSSRERPMAALRRFGLTVSVPFLAIGGWLAWHERISGLVFIGLAAALGLTALVHPRALGPVERVWMALARAMGVVSTFVILTLTFALVITPMALLLRLLRRDPLALRIERDRVSYWERTDPKGPASRPDRPF